MADLAGLKEFVESKGGNRGKAEFFVGRKDELALIENACVQTMRRKLSPSRTERENDPGVILFAGAPGMGKSALLAEATDLARDVRGENAAGGTDDLPKLVKKIQEKLGLDEFGFPLVINTGPEDLKSEKSLLDLCAEQAHILKDGVRNRALALGTEMLAEQFSRIDPDRVFDELRRMNVLDRPLVLLMIDEAQNSDEDNTGLYEKLHLGLHQLPIVPVFAGLSDSRAALKKAGISRLARGRYVQMKMLDDSDCEEAMRAFLDRYEVGVPERARRDWEDLAMERSARFPHHLNTVLIAAAQTAIDHGGKLDSSLIGETGQAIEEWKDGYYAEQAVDFRPGEGRVAAQIVERATRNGEDPDDLAKELLPQISSPRMDEHGNVDVVGFVRRMEHSGMLWRADANRYECPIPTFEHWLQRKFGQDGREERT